METIAKRAKAAREYANMTQKEAEAASGVKQASISKIERGDTTRTMSLLALARVYRADPNWLDTGDGPAPWDPIQIRRAQHQANEPAAIYRVVRVPPELPHFAPGTPDTVPLISWSQAANWDIAGKHTADRWIPCIAHHSPEKTYALRVEGDSMAAASGELKSYPEGSIIFVDTNLKMPADGERVIALVTEGGKLTFKEFKEQDGPRWLLPLNPKHEPIRTAFVVLGTVIGKWEDED
ncbi:XRE family transcriptional regulator [Variovorax sp. ZS18.2.2]|uniref:helix-turn-helix domain-containing protein n=1 Tax=Variovorax sp. ZS18.2.2 TaxID=2971255 RepID=UPI0021518DAF|nr:XRE family transcriptional regulator [Variovorax sp. ZS18.2.2]MCR6476174.1 XRE family transcriptional regulator [Variovorax sp. ZS18.2.2]